MPRLVTVLLAAATLPVAAGDPKTDYWLHCSGCHRLDGSGAPPEVPTLMGEPGRILGLPGGRDYLVRIPGVAQAGLEDAPLAEVMNFMLRTFSAGTLPAGFEPFTAEEVGTLRRRVLHDPLRCRAAILAGGGADARVPANPEQSSKAEGFPLETRNQQRESACL